MDKAGSTERNKADSVVSPVNNVGRWFLARKLWIIVGLMVSILSISGVVAHVQIQTIKKSVLQVTRIEEPLEEAVLEMDDLIDNKIQGALNRTSPDTFKKLEAALNLEQSMETIKLFKQFWLAVVTLPENNL